MTKKVAELFCGFSGFCTENFKFQSMTKSDIGNFDGFPVNKIQSASDDESSDEKSTQSYLLVLITKSSVYRL